MQPTTSGSRSAQRPRARAGKAAARTAGATQTTPGDAMAAATTATAAGSAAAVLLPPSSSPQDPSPASSTATAAAAMPGALAATAAPKRQRVSRACDPCRAMREKCDGAQPQCSSCVAQRRACSYKTSPKKRGVQTGYIRTLELTLSSLLDEVPGCAEAVDRLFCGDAALFQPEASAAGAGGQPQPQPQQQQQQQRRDVYQHNRLHRLQGRWNKSRARREIQRLLSTDALDTTRPLSDRASDDEADTGEGGPPLPVDRPPPSWSPATSMPSPLSGTPGRDEAVQPSLPPHHWRLLDVYFSYTHCWFPVFERQDVLKAVYQHERERPEPTAALLPPTAPPTTPPAAVAELWSVLALAAFQDAASQRLHEAQTPSMPPVPPSPPPHWPPHRIYHVARQMIPLDDGPFEIQHARALLLLALINLGQQRYTAVGVLVALARQIVQEVSDRSDGPSPSTRRVIDTVASGCCILDTFLHVVCTSLGHRRRRRPDWPHSCSALPEDGLDEWQSWSACAGFGAEAGSSSDRNPAYSLTTFNQLHALFASRPRELRLAASPTNHDNHVSATPGDILNRVLRRDIPFSAFVQSTDWTPLAAPVVPSAYVLRVAFVWMRLLAARDAGGNGAEEAGLLAADLEQFVAKFGAAGAPPLLVPLRAVVVEHPSFATLPSPLQQRLRSLGDLLEQVWHVPGQQPVAVPQATTNAAYAAAQRQRRSTAPLSNLPAATTGLVDTCSNAPTETSPVVYASASPEAAAAAHPQPPSTVGHRRMSYLEGQPLPPPALAQQHPSTLYAGHQPPPSSAFGFHPLHILPQSASPDQQQQQQQQQTYGPMMGTPYVGMAPVAVHPATEMAVDFAGGSTMDYDALLDDLAAVDYLDRLDTDVGPQFMANLGFVPGVDNLGMGEFGGL